MLRHPLAGRGSSKHQPNSKARIWAGTPITNLSSYLTTVRTWDFAFRNSLERVGVPFAFEVELPCRRPSGRRDREGCGYPQQSAVR